MEAYHISFCRAFDVLDALAFLYLGDYSPRDSLIVFAHFSRLEWLWFNCKKKKESQQWQESNLLGLPKSANLVPNLHENCSNHTFEYVELISDIEM